MATVVELFSHGFTRLLFTCVLIIVIVIIIVIIVVVIIIVTHSISATLAVKSYCCQLIETSGCFLLTSRLCETHTGHRGAPLRFSTSNSDPASRYVQAISARCDAGGGTNSRMGEAISC